MQNFSYTVDWFIFMSLDIHINIFACKYFVSYSVYENIFVV